MLKNGQTYSKNLSQNVPASALNLLTSNLFYLIYQKSVL